MENKLKLTILLGTARDGRQSEKAAKFVLAEAEKFGFEAKFVDVKDFPLTKTGRGCSPAWSEIVKGSDGLVIVSPEYNHGYPGELKLLLDSAYDEYLGKPIGICGLSAGLVGGARMAMALEPVIIELGAIVKRPLVFFPKIQTIFDEAGNTADSSFAEKLKLLFENISKK